MKSFLRENPTIAFGLGLPLLLVVSFLLISGIPSLLVDSPEYDVLYTSEYYNRQEGLQISVVDRKVQAVYRGNLQGQQLPRLWRYNSKTGGVQEIALVLPPDLTSANMSSAEQGNVLKLSPVEMPDLEGVVVDSSSIAPDGYEFSAGDGRYSGNVFGGMFNSSRNRNRATLSKNGRSIRLPNADNYNYWQGTRFIGWVVTP